MLIVYLFIYLLQYISHIWNRNFQADELKFKNYLEMLYERMNEWMKSLFSLVEIIINENNGC